MWEVFSLTDPLIELKCSSIVTCAVINHVQKLNDPVRAATITNDLKGQCSLLASPLIQFIDIKHFYKT